MGLQRKQQKQSAESVWLPEWWEVWALCGVICRLLWGRLCTLLVVSIWSQQATILQHWGQYIVAEALCYQSLCACCACTSVSVQYIVLLAKRALCYQRCAAWAIHCGQSVVLSEERSMHQSVHNSWLWPNPCVTCPARAACTIVCAIHCSQSPVLSALRSMHQCVHQCVQNTRLIISFGLTFLRQRHQNHHLQNCHYRRMRKKMISYYTGKWS